MTNTLNRLRDRHPEFIYQNFDLKKTRDRLVITLHYRLAPDISFTSEYRLPYGGQAMAGLSTFAFHLGLIELLSYWKAACSPVITVQAGQLAPAQIDFFRRLLFNGLGEFFYVNHIDFTTPDFITVTGGGAVYPPQSRDHFEPGTLLGIGGGKDSALAYDLISQSGPSVIPFSLNPTQKAQDLLESSANPGLVVTRKLDPALLALNRQGYLNGHTPFSALVAAIGTTLAYLYGYQTVMVANESSANHPSLRYKGMPINHQYSKSFAFESDFHRYSHRYLSPHIDYLSLLRPLNELQIAALLSKRPHLFDRFVSCNVKGARGEWCLRCHKCAFTYLMLSAFLPPATVGEIFPGDMFAAEQNLSLFKDLILPDTHKPLDCVGTEPESACALGLTISQFVQAGRAVPKLLDTLSRQTITPSPDQCRRLLTRLNPDHLLPKKYHHLLQHELTRI